MEREFLPGGILQLIGEYVPEERQMMALSFLPPAGLDLYLRQTGWTLLEDLARRGDVIILTRCLDLQRAELKINAVTYGRFECLVVTAAEFGRVDLMTLLMNRLDVGSLVKQRLSGPKGCQKLSSLPAASVMWLRERKCVTDSDIAGAGMFAADKTWLQDVLAAGWKPTEEPSRVSDIQRLKLLHKHGCPFGHGTYLAAIKSYSDLGDQIVQTLVHLKAPMEGSPLLCALATKNRQLDIANMLHQAGLDCAGACKAIRRM